MESTHGGAVPGAGTNLYDYGTEVTASVTNTPKAYGVSTQTVCTGWTGTASVTNGSGTNTTFTLTNDSSIAWALGHERVAGHGGGRARQRGRGDQWVRLDSNVTVWATADEGYHFAGWTGDVPTAGHE